MLRALVLGVTDRLQLEGAVLHVEVVAQALPQPVQHLPRAAVGDARLVHHDVRGQHRHTAGDRPGVQVVHVDDASPTSVGADVSVGHRAVLHGCEIGDGALVGMGATVMSGAVIGAGAMVAAGALVTPGKVVPPGVLAAGVPARVVRDLTAAERAHRVHNAAHYLELAADHRAALAAAPDPA